MTHLTALICGFISLLVFVASSGAQDANVVLTLEGGVATSSGDGRELMLEFPLRDGQWPEKGWGWSFGLNRGHHDAHITKNTVDGDTRVLTVDVKVRRDYWAGGGKGRYTLRLPAGLGDGELKGSYTGMYTAMDLPRPDAPRRDRRKKATSKDNLPPELRKMLEKDGKLRKKEQEEATGREIETWKRSGAVRIAVNAPWPGKVEGFTPPKAGEHPRLVFRRSDLERFKQGAAKTPEGRAMLQQFWDVLEKKGLEGNPKFNSWPAVGYGFAYQMTGDKAYAETARRIIQKVSIDSRPGGQDIHHGPALMGLALAFDLCYDAWDEDFRTACIDELEQRMLECATGTYGGRTMGGFNPNPWSNHNGIRAGAYGLAALALIGETNSAGETIDNAPMLADHAAREVRTYLQKGLGGGAYCMEGMFYKGMTMRRGLMQFMWAYRTAAGKRIDSPGIGDWLLAGHFLEAAPGRTFVQPKKFDGTGSSMTIDDDNMPDLLWTLGLQTVPADMMPGVKQLLEHNVGLQGDKTYGIDWSVHAPFVMASYPFDVAARPPAENFRWMSPDPFHGHYVFRPELRDENDILMVLNLKSNILRGCHYERAGRLDHFTLHGFGTRWLDGQWLTRMTEGEDDDGERVPFARAKSVGNDMQGPVVVDSRSPGEKVHVIDMDLRNPYLYMPGRREKIGSGAKLVHLPNWKPMVDLGVRGWRSIAVDASGKCGAPLLVAVVEHIAEPSGYQPRWQLPVSGEPEQVTVDGRRFRLVRGDASVAGVLLAGEVGKREVSTDAATKLIVFTLQKGAAPRLETRGEGLDATVTVGGRTIRVDKTKRTLVIE